MFTPVIVFFFVCSKGSYNQDSMVSLLNVHYYNTTKCINIHYKDTFNFSNLLIAHQLLFDWNPTQVHIADLFFRYLRIKATNNTTVINVPSYLNMSYLTFNDSETSKYLCSESRKGRLVEHVPCFSHSSFLWKN